MKKYYYIFLLCLIHVISEGQNILEISAKNFPKAFVPDQFYTVFYEVSMIQSDEAISGELISPKGLNIITSKKHVINSSNKLRFSYTIVVDKINTIENDSIVFNLIKNRNIIQSHVSIINTIKIRKIEFSSLEIPDLAKEGDTLNMKFLIQNLGNTTEKIKIELPKNDLNTQIDSILLTPNSAYELISKRKIPASFQNSWSYNVDYKVWLKDSINPIRNFINIPVYSSKLKNNGRLLLPIEVGAWYNNFMFGSELKQATQFDLRGNGFLDFDNKHYVDFIVHGPNQLSFPGIGSFDQYSLDYKYKEQFTAKIGDYNLQFSHILEFGRFGRGAFIEQKNDKIGFKAFYMKARFNPNQKKSFGASFSFKPIKDYAISVNYLFKEAKPQNSTIKEIINSQFVSITSNLNKKNIRLLTEIGTNLSGFSKEEMAATNQLNITYKKITFNSQLIYAGSRFYGFYNDSWLASNGLNIYVNKNINIGINSNFIRTNPNLDLINYNTSPYENRNLIYINFRAKDKQSIQLSYNLVSREDQLEPKTFHFKENFSRLAYNLNTKLFNLALNGSYGFAKNLLIENDNNGRNESYSVSALPEVKILKWASIGGFAQFDRNNKFTETAKDYYFYGGVFRLHFSKALNAYFQYRNNYAPDELTQQRSFMDANLNLDLNRHRFSVSGGKAFVPTFGGESQNTLFFTLKYALKIGMPVARNKKIGSIVGNLSSLSNDINKAGVLIKLGERSFLTDSSGKFYFNNLTPDNYYITLDKSRLASGIVTEGRSTIKVTVKKDSVSNVKFELIKSGGIVGKVNFIKNISSESEEIKPIILAKLWNEKNSFLTQVNLNSEFSFKEIKTGNWQLKIWAPGKEEEFSIENAEQNIFIEANKIQKQEFAVRYIERKIYFSSTNFNLIAKNEKIEQKNPILNSKKGIKSTEKTSINPTQIEKTSKPIIKESLKTFDKVSINLLKTKSKIKIENPSQQFLRKLQNTILVKSESIAVKTFIENQTSITNLETNSTLENQQSDSEIMPEPQNKERQRK